MYSPCLSFLSPVFVSIYFSLIDLLLVMGLCDFQVFNQGVNCRLLSGTFLISVSRWSQQCRTESKSLWRSLKGGCVEKVKVMNACVGLCV